MNFWTKTGVLATVVACSLMLAMPGGAVTGGTAVTPAPSWAAYIVVHRTPASVCSGALVGSRWILTSAQCVAGTTQSPCKFLKPYPATAFTVYLGRTGTAVKGMAYKVSSVALHNNSSTTADDQCVLQNDVALLRLTTPVSRTPLWLAPSEAAVMNGTNSVLHGYGLTDAGNAKSYGSLRRTNASDWTLDSQCVLVSLIGATCLDQVGSSAGSGGDTGGPWTVSVDGNPVEALVFSGYDAFQGVAYGTGVAQPATGAWLRGKLGIPAGVPGAIVRDPASGTAWLIDSQGYRRPIPNASTFACLTGAGHPVTNLAATTIGTMAARTIAAACGTGDRVLIAGAGDGGYTAPNDNVTALLANAGYDVTESATLPADLSSFGQVWWVSTDAPTSGEQAQLVSFEQAGGGVFLTGERPCCEALNSADTTMINAMVVGGGVTAGGQGNVCTCTVPDAVNPNLAPDLLAHPFSVNDWTPSQPGALSGVPDSSVIAYYNGKAVAAAWDRASLVGNGRLVVFMDINWTEQGYRGGNWSDVAQNVALYLSGLSAPPGPVVP